MSSRQVILSDRKCVRQKAPPTIFVDAITNSLTASDSAIVSGPTPTQPESRASVSLRVSKPEADHCGDGCMKVLACCNACHFSCAENSSSCRNLHLSTALVVRTYGSGFRVYEGVLFRRVPWDGAYRGISGVYKHFGSLP